ncbi:VOC family protein [Agreia sp. VKM Ac-1783]|uniref:VOC family protein n=1 Tax=Agreia sp. VKM Ac-1783 TaxID=1938889 RepID=UPI000A2AE331|nr:VOC family protein [Agreia sp. VKM Ac-1783]SMQ70754.1 Catechol 2,3-dioxygenase [Agreia sp. VKM Ac-1783]
MTNSTPHTVKLGRFAPTLAVTDIDRSISFFREFLALEVHFTNGQPVGFAIVRNGAAELHLTLVKNHHGGSHNVAHLLVDDAAALYSTMDAAGVRMIKGLRDADYGVRGFVFCDPDGNRIDVGQSMR